MVPHSDDALLGRKETADALTALGFKVSAATLTTKACRGGDRPINFSVSAPLSLGRHPGLGSRATERAASVGSRTCRRGQRGMKMSPHSTRPNWRRYGISWSSECFTRYQARKNLQLLEDAR